MTKSKTSRGERSHVAMRRKEKTVLIFGTFDRLHPGHRDFFRQARRFGRVHVVVARDARVKKIKKRFPTQSERTRLRAVKKEANISDATLGHSTNLLTPIVKLRPDVIALGFDQKTFSISALKSKLKTLGLAPKIVRLKPFHPERFKSSLLRIKN